MYASNAGDYQSPTHVARLQRNFDKYASNKSLEKEKFQHVLVEEIVDAALKKAQYDTLQRWEDLTQLGVLEEVWDACFGYETSTIQFQDLLTVFKQQGEEKSEAEKLLDLCSEDEALRNHVFDLEECLQSNKDMLAASDILVEEQGEKMKNMEKELRARSRDVERMKKREKELEALKMKQKNMESEQRLLKRDFDLIFATNKSVQKKMERLENENRALRKTIITLANQLEKNEREKFEAGITSVTSPIAAPVTVIPAFQVPTNDTLNVQISTQAGNYVPQTEGQYAHTYTTQEYVPEKPPHMVWDPAIRALVPITGDARKNKRKEKGKNRWKDNSGVSNGKLISPFPRRYTSSHLPRYRRKFEISEKSRFDKQNNI